jgi:plastocyanin
MLMRHRTVGRALGTLLVALAAASARAEVVHVRIEKIAYLPQKIAAHVGDTIEWVNADIVAHTATARNGAWDVMVPPNATRRITLKAAGTVDYYCRFHPNMTGQIIVAE